MKKYFFLVVIFVVLFSIKAHSQTINWEKKFSSARTGRSLQTLADGGYITTGGYQIGSIIRTNAQGDSLWGKNFGSLSTSNSVYFYAIKSVSDGYIAVGSLDSKPYIMKLDLNGVILWDKTIGGTSTYGEIFSCVPVADGIVCTGYLYSGSSYQMMITKLSFIGDSLWMKSIAPHTTTSGRVVSSTSGNAIIASGSNYIITGIADTEIYLLKTDANGNRLWDRCYGGVHSASDNDEGKSVRETADGGFIICGGRALSNSSYNTEIALIKTSSDGTLTWQKSVPGSGGYGFDILAENDGYVLVGNLGGNISTGHIFRTNLQGDVIFDKQLGAGYVYGLDKAINGSYTVIGAYVSPNTMYLGNVTTTPPRYFIIRDAKNNPIANKDVTFYKGTMSPGNDTRIIGQTTDANGKIKIDPAWYKDGDNVHAVIEAMTIATQKPMHTDTIIKGVAYRVILDNVKFDERSSLPLTNVNFYQYKSDPSILEQQLTLDHTTVLFDLLVSIEWDADNAFTDEMKNGIMLASNYLYDVFDGQVALGKVAIYDDKVSWNGADVCYTGSSETWPHAGLQGYLNTKIGDNEQVFMPPRWFGGTERTRNSATSDNWLGLFIEDTWRTLAHELGHQIMGFRDEYKDALGNTIASGYNLGFMDAHYSDSANGYTSNLDKIYSSELSSAERYRNEDKVNVQFAFNRSDCWTYFKQQFEKIYSGVYCPIYKPSERKTLAAGANWLLGPNENSYSGSAYNASSMTKVTIVNKNTSLSQYLMTVSIPTTPTSTPANLVKTFLTKKSTGRLIDLGLTNTKGQIRFLGAENGDSYLFSGNVGGKTTGQAVTLNGTFSLSKKGDGAVTALDSSIALNYVKGEYRIVPLGSLNGADNFDLKLKVNTGFSQSPTAEVPNDYAPSEQLSFTYDAGKTTYNTQIDSLPMRGPILVTGYDEANTSFIIPLSYSTSSFSTDMYGDNGAAWLLLDSINASSIQKVTIISSGFSTLLNGLPPDVEQAGNVHSIIINPSSTTLIGNNALTIRYSNEDLQGQSPSSLRIFKWNENTSIWEKIGGSIDTVHNEVNAKITSAGTYAAFTTGSSTGVLEENEKIQDITLSSVSGGSGTIVHLDLPRRENVTISITNSLGIPMMTLASGELTAGGHDFQMNTSTLPSGIYFCTARTMNTSKTIKIMAIK